jgi:hypothetical protein
MGPLDVELEVLNYERSSPRLNNWLGAGSVGGSVPVHDREAGVPSVTEAETLQPRAFISGMQLISGASVSFHSNRLIAIAGGQISTGAFTIIPLDADDVAVGEQMTEITSARGLLESRLNTLSQLSPGWLDGEGVTPTPAAVEAARHLIWVLLNHRVPRPRLAPTPEGGVEAEWSLGDREVSVTFEPDGSLYGNSVDVIAGEVTEPELSPVDHRAIADFVLGA